MMKRFLLTNVFLVLGTTLLLASNPIESPNQKLRKQIIDLLETPNIEFDPEFIQARVHFTLNQNGEIVILDIESQNPLLETYIKRKINYQKVHLNGLMVRSEFYIDFKIEKT